MDPERLAQTVYRNPTAKQNPGLAVSLAGSQASDMQIREVFGTADSIGIANVMSALPADRAAKLWDSMSESERRRAVAGGFSGPIQRAEGGGFWGGLRGGIKAGLKGLVKAGDEAGVDEVVGAVAEPTALAAGALWDALAVVPDAAKQAYRANMYANDREFDGNIFERIGAGLQQIAVVPNVIQYWDEVEDGNKVYNESALTGIQTSADPTMFALAKWAADGELEKQGELIAALAGEGNTAGAEQIARTLESKEYKDLVDKLNDAKISFGRDVTRNLLRIPEGSDAFNIASGTFDAAYTIGMDPLTYVPVGQVYESARYGLKTSQATGASLSDIANANRRLDKVFGHNVSENITPNKLGDELPAARPDWNWSQKAVRRATDEIGEALVKIRNQGTPEAREAAHEARDRIQRKYGRWLKGDQLDDLLRSNVVDSNTYKEYLKTSAGLTQMAMGNSAVRVKVVPYRHKVREEFSKKVPFGKQFRWGEEGVNKHREILDQAIVGLNRVGHDLGDLTDVEREALEKGVSAASSGSRAAKLRTVKRRMKTRLPTMKDGMFDVQGPGATENFNNLALMFVPKFMADRLTTVYAAADTAGRKQIVKGVFRTAINSFGLEGSAAGKDVSDRMLRTLDALDRPPRRYSAPGATDIDSAVGLGDDSAWLLSQTSTALPLPDFADFMTAMAKAEHANGLINATNNASVDFLTQRIWRTSILLRPALAFRNANEEILNNFVRSGVAGRHGMVAQFATAKVGQARTREMRETLIGETEASRAALLDEIVGRESVFDGGWSREGLEESLDDLVASRREHLKTIESEGTAKVQGLQAQSTKLFGMADAATADGDRLMADMKRFPNREAWDAAERRRTAANRTSGRGDTEFRPPPAWVTDPSVGEAEARRAYARAGKFRDEAEEISRQASDAGTEWMTKFQLGEDELKDVSARVGDANALIDNARSRATGIDQDSGRMMRALVSPVNAVRAVMASKWVSGSLAAVDRGIVRITRSSAEALTREEFQQAILDRLDPSLWTTYADAYVGKKLAQLGEAYLEKMNPQALRYLDELVSSPQAAEIMREEVFGAAKRSARLDIDSKLGPGVTRKPNGEYVRMKFVQTGQERMNTASDEGVQAWAIELNEWADDAAGLEALRWADDPERGWERVLQALQSNPRYATEIRRMDDPERYARGMISQARARLSDNAGVFNEDLFRKIVTNRAINRDRLEPKWLADNVEPTARPAEVNADPRGVMVELDTNVIVALTERGWQAVGDTVGYLSRHYQFVDQYVRVREELAVAEAMFAKEMQAASLRSATVGPFDGKQVWESSGPEGRILPQLLSEKDEMGVWSFRPAYEDPKGKSPAEILGNREVLFPPMSDVDAEAAAAAEFTRRAMGIATERMLAYVDNPKVRSQAAVMLRNLAPFYRAQEEFFRRWANTAKYSPKAIWRAHLALDAGSDGGLIMEDENGRKIFVYPGSGAIASAITEVGAAIGLDLSMAVAPGNFTGKLQTIAPGFDLDQNIHPFSGPVVAVPLTAVETMTGAEEFRWAEKVLLSKYGYDSKPQNGLVPSWVKAWWPNQATQAADMKNAIADLAAAGIMMPQTDDAAVKAEYMRLVRMQAKGRRVARGILGTTLPSFPSDAENNAVTAVGKALGMDSFSDEYQELIRLYGQDYAYHLYAQVYPGKLPFLVSKNEYAAGVSPPVDPGAADFMSANHAFLRKYPEAAAYMVPVRDGEFDPDAWDMARGLGMFREKESEQFATDISNAAATNTYFDQRDSYDAARAAAVAAGDADAVMAFDEQWAVFKDDYMKMYPLFEQWNNQGSVRNQRRELSLRQMRAMVSDPAAPQTEQWGTIRTMLDAWGTLENVKATYASNSQTDVAIRRDAEKQFHAWALQFGEANPTAKAVYNGTFRSL